MPLYANIFQTNYSIIKNQTECDIHNQIKYLKNIY